MRKKKIKILHVAQAAGGVDRYIRMLLKYLDKEKFENILVCSQDFNREDYDGLVDSFEQIEMNRAIGVSDLNSIKEVRRLIKKYNPDIVYAHSSKAGAIARVADIGLKNHCVYNPHGWAFNMRCSDKKRAMYTAIEKMAAPFCEKIICISDAEKQSALEKKICREDKLQVIFNGVDIEAYESGEHGTVKRSSLGIPEDAYVVGMVGRISPQKAPDVFVKMAKLVKDEIPNAHFVIVGSGNQEAEIRKFVLVCAVKVFCSLFGGSDISKLLDRFKSTLQKSETTHCQSQSINIPTKPLNPVITHPEERIWAGRTPPAAALGPGRSEDQARQDETILHD